MNDISLYFTSIAPNEKEFKEDQIGHSIESFTNEFPEITSGGIAVMYVPEYRGHIYEQNKEGSSEFRSSLYNLNRSKYWKHKLFDATGIYIIPRMALVSV